ncbi:MAG: hypothetical protein JJU34_09825 [Lunatimonas sp.]|uniref:kelch repeat-containing protein n=1 Tax=Lunatimonas sp. TaxID=2060141 RepID=UPI00263BBC7E|nr:kelch repeat-containing protein [Lunatimonas sp.]MCC5937571.1 hypothetical protein [Lunatimonas sp.]
MRQKLFVFALLIASMISACEQAELAPRTNPRFSMAYVQELDATGAQFASNIYDFGSEEILEYGFLYSTQQVPRPANSEVIRQSGKPDKSFSLKAVHSMAKGRTYFVVAFLRTAVGEVYSEPQTFVSQGAEGFLFDRLEFASPVYFGDTVTVHASKLSNNLTNYKVAFQDKEARVIDLQAGSFRFIIPYFENFDVWGLDPDHFALSMEVVDKKMEMSVFMPFQEPLFDQMAIQRIDYGGAVEIRGKYLKDANLVIASYGQPVEYLYNSNVMVDVVGEERLVFRPYPQDATATNYVALKIRGKEYHLGAEVFAYNPTEIDLGQTFVVDFGDYVTITGTNFNVEGPYIHYGVLNGVKVEIDRSASDSKTLTFPAGQMEFEFQRVNEFRIQTFDQVSQHAFTFEFTNPDIPYFRNTYRVPRLADYLPYGNMVGYEGKGFALGNREIFEFDVATQTVSTVRALQIGANKLEFTFGVADGENWYIGGGHTNNPNPINRSFFVFNLRTNEIRRLPDLPLDQWRPMLVHAVNGQVYVEGGFDIETRVDHRLRYKFDIRSETWTRLPDKTETRVYTGRTIAFSYNGRHLAIGEPVGTGDEGTGLFEFDINTETWTLIKRLDELYGMGLKSDDVYVVGNKAYLLGTLMYELNLETLHLRQVTNLIHPQYLTCEVYRTLSFMSEGKIYVWDCFERVWEIDLQRLAFD